MDLSQSIDLYCERIGAGFWAEPLNALSNSAFLIAAYLAWKLYLVHAKSEKKSDIHFSILVALTSIVGIGSFIFHTYATIWALLMDIIPIMVFAFYYFTIALRRIIGCNRWQTAIGLAGFAGFCFLIGRLAPRASLNYSSVYLPFAVVLALFGAVLQYRKQSAKSFWGAAAVFSIALFFRIVDLVACPYISTGTHFLWHILDAVVIYLLLRVLVFAQSTREESGIGAPSY